MNPWLSRKVIGWAHQGGAGEGPANTIQAMKTALGTGIHALECDVQLTSDDELVLHRDAHVVGDGGSTLEIASGRLAELRGVKPDLATLDQALAAFPGVPLTVEVKKGSRQETAVLTARMLAAEGGSRPLIVTSFSAATVSDLKREAPLLDTAPSGRRVFLFWALSRFWLPTPGAGGHIALQVPLRLDQVTYVKHVPLVRRLRRGRSALRPGRPPTRPGRPRLDARRAGRHRQGAGSGGRRDHDRLPVGADADPAGEEGQLAGVRRAAAVTARRRASLACPECPCSSWPWRSRECSPSPPSSSGGRRGGWRPRPPQRSFDFEDAVA